MIYCPNCGTENEETARFCDECGRDLSDVRAARVETEPVQGSQESKGGAAAMQSENGGEQVLWEGRPSPLTSPRMALTNRYKLTSYRLVIQQGFLSRRTEEIELYRFDDVSVTENIFERMTGKGDIHLSTSDHTTPTVTLYNIDDPERIKDMIRDAAYKERERRRIRYRDDI